MYAEEEARLLRCAADGAELEALVRRRLAGVPLEQVLGWAELCGVRVRVTPGVFVPRRRTGLLVREAVRLACRRTSPVVVDLCCGSGAIGAALSRGLPGAEVHACDRDPAAVACARLNLPPERVLAGDLYDALPARLRGCVDLLVANAPYVPSDAVATLPPEARDHEPRAALDGGADGVDVHRRIAAGAPDWLAPGGHLLVESGRRQAPLTVAACEAAGLRARVVTDDELDATAVVATRSVDSRGE